MKYWGSLAINRYFPFERILQKVTSSAFVLVNGNQAFGAAARISSPAPSAYFSKFLINCSARFLAFES